MSVGTLPKHIDVQKWADREAVIEKVYPLSSFPRLQESVADEDGEVAVNVRIHRDAQGYFRIEGRLAAMVKLACQRCLEPLAEQIGLDLQMWLLRDEGQADQLPEDADYLVLDEEGGLALADALEDELILSLPPFPAHQSCDAYPVAAATDADADADAEAPARQNPFQVLASLKGRAGKD